MAQVVETTGGLRPGGRRLACGGPERPLRAGVGGGVIGQELTHPRGACGTQVSLLCHSQ